MMTPGKQNEYKQLTEAYTQVARESGEGNWTPAHKPKRLAANLVKVEGGVKKPDEDGEETHVMPDGTEMPGATHKESGASAQEMNAVRQVVDALRSNKISLKEVDQSAGSIVVSTGGERSVILKVMGFEGDHDVPVSMRPDKRVDSDDEALMSGRRQPNPASPRDRALAAKRGEAAQRRRPPSHSSFDEPSFGRDYD